MAQVQSLVRKLRSCKLHGTAKKKKKEKKRKKKLYDAKRKARQPRWAKQEVGWLEEGKVRVSKQA